MSKDIIVFSDLHLNWKACEIIFDEVKKRNISKVFNLGDEDSFMGGGNDVYAALFKPMIDFKNGGGELICLVGNKTGGIPKELFTNYVGVNEHGRIVGSWIYKNENIIAGHIGGDIVKEYGKFINDYDDTDPLVIFHGHSHSMNVLPEYKWLDYDEKVRTIDEGEITFDLSPGNVYWVNPGAQQYMVSETEHAANFVLYSPQKQQVTLYSVPYKKPLFCTAY